jgi:hypothetical protein
MLIAFVGFMFVRSHTGFIGGSSSSTLNLTASLKTSSLRRSFQSLLASRPSCSLFFSNSTPPSFPFTSYSSSGSRSVPSSGFSSRFPSPALSPEIPLPSGYSGVTKDLGFSKRPFSDLARQSVSGSAHLQLFSGQVPLPLLASLLTVLCEPWLRSRSLFFFLCN